METDLKHTMVTLAGKEIYLHYDVIEDTDVRLFDLLDGDYGPCLHNSLVIVSLF